MQPNTKDNLQLDSLDCNGDESHSFPILPLMHLPPLKVFFNAYSCFHASKSK